MSKVVLQNVTKKYSNNQTAVNNINLEVNDKEFIVLVGPSGCGKSTILRMIAGLEQVTEGKIYIDDKLVNHVPPKDRNIAMVFQNYALYPHMTVFENMAFGLIIRKLPKTEIKKRVTETAEILELQDLLSRKPKALSGGQRQRVALGRAIIRKPKVFLFDEPLSNLDAKLRVQMRTEISKLHQKLKTTMIYVTHDQTEAMTMGDRIVVINNGIIQQVDKPLKIYNNPANKFVAGFIGNPPMNFIDGVISIEKRIVKFKSQHFTLNIGECGTEYLQELENQIVTLGIRPEDILVGNQAGDSHSADIELIEPLGGESLYYLHLNGVKLVAKSTVQIEKSEFKSVKISFKKDRIHIFYKDKPIC